MMWWLPVACQTNPLAPCLDSAEPSICLMERVSESSLSTGELINACQQAVLGEKLTGECIFLISDERRLIGIEAQQMCQQAAPFSEDCLRHAAARDVEQHIFAHVQQARPDPMKLLPRIHGVVRNYLEPQIAESMSRDMVLRFQASRMQDVFQPSDCVGLPLNMCAQIYILGSLGSREQWSANYQETWMTHCGQPLTATLAQEWSWKGWTPSMDAAVQSAFQQICQALPAAKSDSSK